MTAKEKYKEEKDKLKNSRISRILESSFELFAEKGIDNVTMTDIAAKAEIGVASLYRYFATKEEIAVQTSIWAWERQKANILPQLITDNFNNANGITQLSIIFSMFIKLYENQVKFLRYIYFFDSYAVRIKMEKQLNQPKILLRLQFQKELKINLSNQSIKSLKMYYILH